MKIGTEEFTFTRETKKALDIENLLWNIALFALIIVYAFDYIAWPLYLVLFYVFYARFFGSNHDIMHADTFRRWPRFAELIAENLVLCVVPWREPYDSVRKKHMTHHRTHRPGKTPVFDTRNDPHSAFEMGGLLRAFLSCLFFEEAQLYFDIRDGQVAKSRWFILIVYLPLQILFLISFGWQKYLVILGASRIAGGLFWFVFSYSSHRYPIYRFGFKTKAPRLLQLMVGLSNGKRTMYGQFRHAGHHAWPSVPSSGLDDLDSAILRNPGAAPQMIPSTR